MHKVTYVILFVLTMYIVQLLCYNKDNEKDVFLEVYSGGGKSMESAEKKKQYNLEYAKTKLKRIPLDVQKDKYDQIKAHAGKVGESVNGYIKKAVDERMKRESTE